MWPSHGARNGGRSDRRLVAGTGRAHEQRVPRARDRRSMRPYPRWLSQSMAAALLLARAIWGPAPDGQPAGCESAATEGVGQSVARSVGTRTLRTPGQKKTVGRSVTLRAARNKGRRLGKNARCRGATNTDRRGANRTNKPKHTHTHGERQTNNPSVYVQQNLNPGQDTVIQLYTPSRVCQSQFPGPAMITASLPCRFA
jgi:hypothetical protein